MNKVILMGRLTRDPSVTYNGDTATAKYSLAVDRRGAKDGQQTADFINIVAWGKNAEFAEKYLHKGTKILIEGRIVTGSYTNKEGQKVYTTDIAVDSQEFCESKSAQSQGGIDYKPNFGTPAPERPQQMPAEGFMNFPDGEIEDDLPFGPVTR